MVNPSGLGAVLFGILMTTSSTSWSETFFISILLWSSVRILGMWLVIFYWLFLGSVRRVLKYWVSSSFISSWECMRCPCRFFRARIQLFLLRWIIDLWKKAIHFSQFILDLCCPSFSSCVALSSQRCCNLSSWFLCFVMPSLMICRWRSSILCSKFFLSVIILPKVFSFHFLISSLMYFNFCWKVYILLAVLVVESSHHCFILPKKSGWSN